MQLSTEIIENQDGKFLIFTNDGIGGHLKRGDRWEPHFTGLIENLSLEGTTVLDIGANMGCNTVALARAVGNQGLVVSIEPLRITFQQLCGNVILNGLFNVLTLQYAIGEENGHVVSMEPVNYFAEWVNVGDTRVGTGGDVVELRTLDSFSFSNVSFVKIDVQGSELAVLRGATRTLATHRPLLFVEIEDAQCLAMGTSPGQVRRELLAARYILLHILNDYPVDYLCVPVERKDEVNLFATLVNSPINIIQP
jgi:FkbM family methyltransferase